VIKKKRFYGLSPDSVSGFVNLAQQIPELRFLPEVDLVLLQILLQVAKVNAGLEGSQLDLRLLDPAVQPLDVAVILELTQKKLF
jgi:hypothetical protein